MPVVEGGDDSGNHATAIGKCVVTDLPPALPAKTPVIVQFFYMANGRLSVKASLPDVGSESSVSIERASGMTENDLRSWASRIEQGQFFDTVPTAKPVGGSGPPPRAAKAAVPAATPVAADDTDFEPPQTFDDDEDSEVFSDLDF